MVATEALQSFEDADAMAGASGAGTPRMGGDSGDYADPAGAFLDDGFIRSLIFNQTDSLLSYMKATTLSQIQNPQ
jgi:hypothetical protein